MLIIDIYWERVNLHLKLNKKIHDKVILTNNNELYELNYLNDEIIINITNTPEGAMLKKGIWNIFIGNDKLKISKDILNSLSLNSRFFPYRGGLYAYTVKLDTNEYLEFILKTNFMVENTKPQKYYRLIEKKSFLSRIKIFIKELMIFLTNCLYSICHFFSINKNKNILFLTETNNELTGNLKYLYDYLVKKNYNIKIFAYDIKDSKSLYLKELLAFASSNTIIIDNYVSMLTHLKLNNKTKIIQLWHAGIGFKAVGYARFGEEGSPHPYKSSHRRCNYVIVDKEELINIYQELFGIKKECLLPYGMPRIMNYLNKDIMEESIKELYKLNPNFKTKKVILFAPTYRGQGKNSAYYDMNMIDLAKINEYCLKNNALFIIKMHPFIKDKIIIKSDYQNNIIDYSNMDINKLLYITDILITDYSSCAYEYSFFNRPLIYYRYDKEIYEYLRPPHTLNLFTDKNYEVKTFEELLKTLEKIKVKSEERFENINNKTTNACEIITNNCIGEKK